MSISSVATDLFSNCNAMADLEDTRNFAIDQATVAVLQMCAPEMVTRYLDDNLPESFERLLDRATASADVIAVGSEDASYVEAYHKALTALLEDDLVLPHSDTLKASH
jgi:hypothetical protein